MHDPFLVRWSIIVAIVLVGGLPQASADGLDYVGYLRCHRPLPLIGGVTYYPTQWRPCFGGTLAVGTVNPTLTDIAPLPPQKLPAPKAEPADPAPESKEPKPVDPAPELKDAKSALAAPATLPANPVEWQRSPVKSRVTALRPLNP